MRTQADKSEEALDKVHLGVHLDSFMVGCEADIVSLDGNSGEKSKIECAVGFDCWVKIFLVVIAIFKIFRNF